MSWSSFIRTLWWIGLGLMLVSMPFLRLGMSIAGFWLAGVWIFDYIHDCVYKKEPGKKWRLLWQNKAAMLLTAIFGLHLVGLLWTSNLDYGFHDLRIKLPLLFMPLVFVGAPKISQKVLHILLWIFIAALVVSSAWCLNVYFTQGGTLLNIRKISVFISHIRFSLMIVLGIALLAYLFWKSKTKWRFASLVLIAYFLFFLWLLQSATGYIVLIGVFIGWCFMIGFKTSDKKLKTLTYCLPFIVVIAMSGYLYSRATDYFLIKSDPVNTPAQTSAAGNPYEHDMDNTLIENGYYVWRNISWKELNKEWNHRSTLDYSAKDRRGQRLSSTLLRYLTSKGLTKDSVGVHSLSDHDIQNIEKGVTNYQDPQKIGLSKRIDKIFFEINAYRNGGDPSGNSVTQRLEFWRAGFHIVKENPVIGVGTGDVPNAFDNAYAEIDSPLNDRWRLRAHNQYFTMAIAFGSVGLIVFLYCFLYPFSRKVYRQDMLYLSFFIISALSFLNEDTLETQAGITFFTFFSCFFLFSYNRDSIRTSL